MSGLHTIMISSDPGLAGLACAAGVDEIMVDLETGAAKKERQKGLGAWMSDATPEDVSRLRETVAPGALLVRVNPLGDGSQAEVDDAIARGADAVMLPMFRDRDTVARFCDLVRGRARVVPLAETRDAVACVEEVVRETPIDRLHFGLNDLQIELGHKVTFQPVAEGALEQACSALRAAGTAFGIGGVGRANGTDLVPAEVILGEHVRLGSTWAILSRSFRGKADGVADLARDFDFSKELRGLSAAYDAHQSGGAAALDENRHVFNRLVADWVARKGA